MEENCGPITFFSNFDSGNLARVEQVEGDDFQTKNAECDTPQKPVHDLEYNVWTKPDCMHTEFENGNRTWFYFGIKSWSNGKVIKINVMNMNKQCRLYNQGMAPVVRVAYDGKENSWERIKNRVTYQMQEGNFVLSFSYKLPDSKATAVFFAFCYPFSYSECQEKLNNLQETFPARCYSQPPGHMIYFHRELLCRSLEQRRIELITISSYDGIMEGREKRIKGLFPDMFTERAHQFKGKRVFFLTSRVHPGETPSSFVFNGFLDFILRKDDQRAMALRKLFVFKLVPMLNPDGVYNGFYRTDTRGVNLNRVYSDPDPFYHPSIFAVRSLILYHHEKDDNELLSGMSIERNFFNQTNITCHGLEKRTTTEDYAFEKVLASNTSAEIKTGLKANYVNIEVPGKHSSIDCAQELDFASKNLNGNVEKDFQLLSLRDVSNSCSGDYFDDSSSARHESQVISLVESNEAGNTNEVSASNDLGQFDNRSYSEITDGKPNVISNRVHPSDSNSVPLDLTIQKDLVFNSDRALSRDNSTEKYDTDPFMNLGSSVHKSRIPADSEANFSQKPSSIELDEKSGLQSNVYEQVSENSPVDLNDNPTINDVEVTEVRNGIISPPADKTKEGCGRSQEVKGEVLFVRNTKLLSQNLEECWKIKSTTPNIQYPDSSKSSNGTCLDSNADTLVQNAHKTVFSNEIQGQLKQANSNVSLYVDLHGHASKRGCFIYANHIERLEDQVEALLFPKLMSLNSANFDFEACNFSLKNMMHKDKRDGMSKEGSGRVAIFKATGLLHSYTLECNYNTGRFTNTLQKPESDDGRITPPPMSSFPPKYTPEIYAQVGRALAISALDMEGKNPYTRITSSEFHTLKGIRQWLSIYIRSTRSPMSQAKKTGKLKNQDETNSSTSKKVDSQRSSKKPFKARGPIVTKLSPRAQEVKLKEISTHGVSQKVKVAVPYSDLSLLAASKRRSKPKLLEGKVAQTDVKQLHEIKQRSESLPSLTQQDRKSETASAKRQLQAQPEGSKEELQSKQKKTILCRKTSKKVVSKSEQKIVPERLKKVPLKPDRFKL